MNDKLMESLVSKLQEDNLQDYGNTTDYNYFYNKQDIIDEILQGDEALRDAANNGVPGEEYDDVVEYVKGELTNNIKSIESDERVQMLSQYLGSDFPGIPGGRVKVTLEDGRVYEGVIGEDYNNVPLISICELVAPDMQLIENTENIDSNNNVDLGGLEGLGDMLSESQNVKEDLYVYTDANADSIDIARANVDMYKKEAPTLEFKIYKNNNDKDKIFYIDMIGSKKDIQDFIVNNLGWYTDEEIDKLNVIKPYKSMKQEGIVDFNVDTGDILSGNNLDLGGAGALLGMLGASEETKESDNKLEEGRLNFKKYGIVRAPEFDVSDDGNRFTGYICNGVPITYLKDGENVYLSIREDNLEGLTYEEVKQLPSYQDCDKYNGVLETEVDLADVADICKRLRSEYDNALKDVKNVSDEEFKVYTNKYLEKAKREFEEAKKVIRSIDAVDLMNASEWDIKDLKRYLQRTKEAIDDWSWDKKSRYNQELRRDRLQTDTEEAYNKVSWYLEEIQDIANRIKNSKTESLEENKQEDIDYIMKLINESKKVSKTYIKEDLTERQQKVLALLKTTVQNLHYLDNLLYDMETHEALQAIDNNTEDKKRWATLRDIVMQMGVDLDNATDVAYNDLIKTESPNNDSYGIVVYTKVNNNYEPDVCVKSVADDGIYTVATSKDDVATYTKESVTQIIDKLSKYHPTTLGKHIFVAVKISDINKMDSLFFDNRQIKTESLDIQERIKSLKLMDQAARCVNDDDVFELWLMAGVPDGATEEDFEDIAKDDKVYQEVENEFKRVMKLAKENGALYDCPEEALELVKKYEPNIENYVNGHKVEEEYSSIQDARQKLGDAWPMYKDDLEGKMMPVMTKQEFELYWSQRDDREEYADTTYEGYLNSLIDAGVKIDDDLYNILIQEQLEEAKFKDKVKAIKKSLKDKDGRLSDKTAEEQAKKIAGSMIKNEASEEIKEYRYITNHGIGPGTLPEGVFVRAEVLPNYRTAIYTNRPLTEEELRKYDIKPEWIQETKQIKTEGKVTNQIKQALLDLNVSDFQELRDALDEMLEKDIINEEYEDFLDIISDKEEACEDYIRRRSDVTNTDWKDEMSIESDYVTAAIQEIIGSLEESKSIKVELNKLDDKLQMEIYELIQNGRRLDNQDIDTNIQETIKAIKSDYPNVDAEEYIIKKAQEIYDGQYDDIKNESEKIEIKDLEADLDNPNIKGDERVDIQNDINYIKDKAQRENRPLTEAYTEGYKEGMRAGSAFAQRIKTAHKNALLKKLNDTLMLEPSDTYSDDYRDGFNDAIYELAAKVKNATSMYENKK